MALSLYLNRIIHVGSAYAINIAWALAIMLDKSIILVFELGIYNIYTKDP